MNETITYTDLLRAHKHFFEIESRYHFYEAYMNSKSQADWFQSPEIPLKEGLLLFGWVHSWDPNFEGDLLRFLEIYRDIFDVIKEFENHSLIGIDFSDEVRRTISMIFDRIARCCRGQRYESTDASKLLHGIIPSLFIMWDIKIKENLVGGRRDARCYAYEFLPNMQISARHILESYISDKGGDYEGASKQISLMSHNYTLAKLIDEFNYLRYTRKKSLAEIRSIPL